MFPRVDDVEMVEPEIFHGHAHGFCGGGALGVFELEAEAFATMKDEEVEFRAAVGEPEVGVAIRGDGEDLFYAKTFPGGTELGVGLQGGVVGDAEKGMKDAGIADVGFGGFHLALLEVLVPWRELADDEGAGEDVEVASGGRLRAAEGAGEFGDFENISVVVGDHDPESAEGGGGDVDAELGDIAFEESAEEILVPLRACRICGREIGARESATQPEFALIPVVEFRQRKAGDVDE